MTETVVHVTTLEEWKSVLDVWFKQGYDWSLGKGRDDYLEEYYCDGSRQLGLNVNGFPEITYWSLNDYNGDNLIEYSEFMERNEGNDVETYYVTSEQKRLIWGAHESPFSVSYLVDRVDDYYHLFGGMKYGYKFEKDLLRYLSGDSNVRFEVKEPPMYRLVGEDNDGDLMYFAFSTEGAPTYTYSEDAAFTASREDIEKWKTPAWTVEPVKEEK